VHSALTYRNSNIAINDVLPLNHTREAIDSRIIERIASPSLSLPLSLLEKDTRCCRNVSDTRDPVGVSAHNDTSVFARAYRERRFVVARRILSLVAGLAADDARRPRMQEPRVIGAHRRMTTPPAYSVRDASVIRDMRKNTHTEAHTESVTRASRSFAKA